MACADADMRITGDEQDLWQAGRSEKPIMKYYQAAEMLPSKKGPMDELLQKQPAVLGSLQVVSGVLSLGVGIIFAVTQGMSKSLCGLFRVSYVNGILFICAGLVSNFLFMNPGLVSVSLALNIGCIALAVVAAIFIIADLALWNPANYHHLQIEIVELIVLLVGASLSAVLCFWFSKSKRSKSG